MPANGRWDLIQSLKS